MSRNSPLEQNYFYSENLYLGSLKCSNYITVKIIDLFIVFLVDSCIPGDMVTITGVVKASSSDESKVFFVVFSFFYFFIVDVTQN